MKAEKIRFTFMTILLVLTITGLIRVVANADENGSTFWDSIVELIGQFLKQIGKIVIKILGENLSKETLKDPKGKEVIDPKTKKPLRKPFRELFAERNSDS